MFDNKSPGAVLKRKAFRGKYCLAPLLMHYLINISIFVLCKKNMKKFLDLGNGCGAVGQVVASIYRSARFEYSHQQFSQRTFKFLLLTVESWIDENKEKEAGNGLFYALHELSELDLTRPPPRPQFITRFTHLTRRLVVLGGNLKTNLKRRYLGSNVGTRCDGRLGQLSQRKISRILSN